MSKAILIVVSLVFFLVSPHKVFAQVVTQVVINEFVSDSTLEWVEFYNSGATTISLNSWTIQDAAQNPVVLNGDVTPGGYFAYERNGSGWLNNDGDTITLKDDQGNTKDSLVYGSSGSVGAPEQDKSASRVPDGSSTWQNNTNATKGGPNPTATPTPTPTAVPSPSPSPSPTETPTPTPVKTATPSPTPKPTPTKSPTPSPSESTEPEITEFVLGAEESPTLTPNPDNQPILFEGWFTPGKILPFVFIIGGIGILAGVVFTFVRQRKLGYNGQDGDGNKKLGGNTEEST